MDAGFRGMDQHQWAALAHALADHVPRVFPWDKPIGPDECLQVARAAVCDVQEFVGPMRKQDMSFELARAVSLRKECLFGAVH